MKRSDSAGIAIIVLVVIGIAYIVATAVVAQIGGKQAAKVPVVQLISSSVDQPDSAVFNQDAINPTVEVFIGDQATGGGQK